MLNKKERCPVCRQEIVKSQSADGRTVVSFCRCGWRKNYQNENVGFEKDKKEVAKIVS